MLSLVITLVASLAPAQGVAATCGDDAACEAPAAEPLPHDYATPAVVDCRSPNAPLALAGFVGECDGTVVDLSYRVSRAPELEQVTRALQPAPRERHRVIAACDGLPPRGGDLTVTSPEVVAVYATAWLAPGPMSELPPPEAYVFSSRFLDPPDRPPRV
jgi:hypothetical protein